MRMFTVAVTVTRLLYKKIYVLAKERTHTTENPYNCNHCSMAFKNKGIILTHERMHTGEKVYSCSYCNKAFLQKKLFSNYGENTYWGESIQL